MPLPHRRTSHLRWGRVSLAGATYFITACAQRRTTVFANAPIANRVMNTMLSIHQAGDVEVLAATIMPDHVHLLCTLGTRLQLGQIIGKFKTLARQAGKEWQWQEDGFEHRLRQSDSTEDYGFYIFMNPYRAHLIALDQNWPWWICPNPARFSFLSHVTCETAVPQAWVAKSIALGRCFAMRG